MLGDLLDPDQYADLFNSLLDMYADPTVDLPWPRRPGSVLPNKNHYWDRLIAEALHDQPNGNRGKKAWRALVPFRYKRLLGRLSTADRSFVEGWCFPGGIALSITFWLSGEFTSDKIKVAVADLLNGKRPVIWSTGDKQIMYLNDIAQECLNTLRREVFTDVAAGFRPRPTRILTVIRAQHDGSQDSREAEEMAMRDAVLTAAGGRPNPRLEPEGDIYLFPRSLVIWQPEGFLSSVPNLHTLGCLHRNAVIATLHVASLLRATEVLVREVVNSGNPISPRVELYAKAVGTILGRIYGRAWDTYSAPWMPSRISSLRMS